MGLLNRDRRCSCHRSCGSEYVATHRYLGRSSFELAQGVSLDSCHKGIGKTNISILGGRALVFRRVRPAAGESTRSRIHTFVDILEGNFGLMMNCFLKYFERSRVICVEGIVEGTQVGLCKDFILRDLLPNGV